MKKLNKKGFTLIELLAVIVILTLLFVFAVPAISRYMIDNGLVDASTLKVYSYDTDSRIISNDLIQSEQIIEQGNSSHFETETNK